MSNIEDLQARITAALDRAAQGVDALSAGSGGDTAALQAQLDEEKTVNAQLEERLRSVNEKHRAEVETMRADMQDTRAKVDALDLELQRLRQANSELRESNAALRDANAAGVGDAHLINKSMMAELEALRAARAADVAEASAILSALTPVLAQANVTHEGEVTDA